jgi:hypothetical protein
MKKLLLALLLASLPARAAAIELALPIACDIGKDCFVQNYVDTAAASGYADFQCNRLSYDKHDGTDFRLKDYVQMKKGYDVLAAADGIVTAVRDGMEDINVLKIDRASIMKSGCGNAVIVSHTDGWQTMYCHMRKGSVAVKKGDGVKAGQKIGLVGLSGLTEFPHLHMSVKKDGVAIDPFTGKNMETACDSVEPVKPLWKKELAEKLTYIPSALLGMGFTTEKPEEESALEGKHNVGALSPEAPAVILWASVMGAQEGDTLLLQIFDTEGRTMQVYQKDFEKAQATFFAFTGKTNKNIGKWPEGIYRGKVMLLKKEGEVPTAVFSEEREIYVR